MKFCEKKFRSLLFAATMSMLVEYLMGLSDSVVAGNILGENALSAVNLMQSPMNIVSFFANLFGTGTAICFALEVGRFNRRRASEMFSQGLWSVLLTGGALVLAFLCVRGAVLDAFGAPAAVRAFADEYWLWFTPCAALELIAVLLSSSCYADGDGRICIYSYAVQLLGNLGFSFVLTMMLGMKGCSIGTVLGNLGAVAVLSCHFLKKANTLAVVRHFSLADAWHIVKVAFGDASTRLCWAALFFCLNKYVIDTFGGDYLPAVSVVVAVLGFSEAFNGIPTAAQPLVGVYVGEKNTVCVRTLMGAACRTSFYAGMGMMLFLLAFPQLAVKVVGIDDPMAVETSITAVRFTALGFIGWASLMLWNSYYLFIEREAWACFLTFLGNYAMPAACFFALGAVWGNVQGVWLGLGVAPIAAMLLFAGILRWFYGKALFPLLLPVERDAKIHVFDFPLEPAKICGVSAEIGAVLKSINAPAPIVQRVSLLVEETMMAVRDRNGQKPVIAEATLDLNEGVSLVLRDDGEIFDITDADQNISSLRSYLVASLMENQPNRRNLTTTGFNRNVFRF